MIRFRTIKEEMSEIGKKVRFWGIVNKISAVAVVLTLFVSSLNIVVHSCFGAYSSKVSMLISLIGVTLTFVLLMIIIYAGKKLKNMRDICVGYSNTRQTSGESEVNRE